MNLSVKPSQISNAGMGLYTDEDIDKGTLIIEYTGDITSWAKVKDDWKNVYIYFVDDDYVINAKDHPESYARYANDARGLIHSKTLHNNSEFVNIDGRIYIRALRKINRGEEILVSYGEDYWETVRNNSK